jgi:hypothetical protein
MVSKKVVEATSEVTFELNIFLNYLYILQGDRQWSEYVLSLVPTNGCIWIPSWSNWTSIQHDVEIRSQN